MYNSNDFNISNTRISSSSESEEMILFDSSMRDILETISRISFFDSTILITGESGTGKSMLAKYIHNKSKRWDKPFITINCATIPESLIESELFGYAGGAFTNASQKGKSGMVDLADGGTLFLDEIGLLPFELQSKFLQLIQEKTYVPIGSLKTKTVNVRIISATNQDLKMQIKEKKFREDLYYRLRVIEFEMPPLRNRPDAVEPLINYFLKIYNDKFDVKKTITPDAKTVLKGHRWTGNIRELQYIMERLIVTSPEDIITADDIPPFNDTIADLEAPDINFDAAVAQFEKELLTNAFRKYKSSYKVAAALGMTQTRAARLIRKYNIR